MQDYKKRMSFQQYIMAIVQIIEVTFHKFQILISRNIQNAKSKSDRQIESISQKSAERERLFEDFSHS